MTESVADVDSTVAIADPVRRNLRITATYAELSNAFARWLPRSANWCTFATWASRQAGSTIRREDLARVVSQRLEKRIASRPILREARPVLGASAERLAAIVGDVSQALPGIERAAAAVAVGNRKVFAEIGREFARFLEQASRPMQEFVGELRAGSPPEGQELLRRAFMNYETARAAVDGGARAQLVLLANLQIGLHEQTRLQPEIREALDAALLDAADTRRRVLERLEQRFAIGSHGRATRRVLNAVADELSEDLRVVARVVITDHLMSISLPHDRTLRLGRDATGHFPASLTTLNHAELLTLLRAHDADGSGDSGAIDWSVLSQRIRFIADLFRGYQEDPSLFEPPFTS